MRYPKPLVPGDRIAVTAPSVGVTQAGRPRLERGLQVLRDRGYEVVLGDCLMSEDIVSAPASDRAAELTEFLCDPTVSAVMPPWGGELAVEVLDKLDWDRLAQAEPTWLIGKSDITTLMLPLSIRLDWATLYGATLVGLGLGDAEPPDGYRLWEDLTGAESTVRQRAVRQSRYVASQWDGRRATGSVDVVADSLGVGAAFELAQSVSDTGQRRTHRGSLEVEGRLLGGCTDLIASLVGTDFGDVGAFGRRYADDGIILYLSTSEEPAPAVARFLYGMRLGGWFEHVNAVMLGRTEAPDAETLTQRDAALAALGDLGVPIIFNAHCGRLPPWMPLVNGALARVVINDEVAEVTQSFV